MAVAAPSRHDGRVTETTIDVLTATTTERAALARDLAGLDHADWARPSLCGRWTVEEVVAHLTAAASLGRARWMRSVLGARFDFDEHNARRLAEHRGANPAETLARFQAIVPSTTSTFGPKEAWLGEVVIHSADIRRPLGIEHTPDAAATTRLAEFLARTNFTVPSKKVAAGLRLEASDGPFAVGAGPVVRGSTLALVMATAGRAAYLEDLSGPGVAVLAQRVSAAS